MASTATGFRTHNCNELRASDVGTEVTLCGWVQTSRDLNHFAFVDLRDRYGITQCVFQNADGDAATAESLYKRGAKLGREFVVQVTGKVAERGGNKNKERATGEVEIVATALTVLNESKTPPFLIQDKTDAAEDTRMRYRYLDIRRNPIKEALLLRSRVSNIVRSALCGEEFVEVETPVLIKSTPEGAKDFVVPSRMNPGQFYALPQSPQTFKQLLMVAGMDRYFQIVKCFRDEDLRADRQPEFTQIDCEMAFVTQEDVLGTFEKMIRRVFREVKDGYEFDSFIRMPYRQAMEDYGIDKPDLRYEMKLHDITGLAQGKDFKMFDEAGLVIGICLPGQAGLAGKKVKELEKLAKSEQCGAKGMVWVKVKSLSKPDLASSVKKNFSVEQLQEWARACEANEGDLLCVFWGPAGKLADKTRECVGKFRHIMGSRLGLRNEGFCGLWVVDFPLLEWDEDAGRYTAMHHPFTSPKVEDMALMDTDPGAVRANAYDMIINGVEVGGGSIRVHQKPMQDRVFELLGFSKEEAEKQFGFLLGAFEFGAPPHGGLAFGFDRLCTLLGGVTGQSIRDYIAFPKNNQGRCMMINSPSEISPEQLEELKIASTVEEEAAPAAAAAAAK